MGILYVTIYALLSGLGKVFLRRSQKDFPASVSFFIETLFGVAIWVPFGIISGIDLKEVFETFHIVLLSAIMSEAYIFYIYSKGEISITATVFSTFSIYTIFFSYIILGERLSPIEIFLVLLIISGVIILSLPKKEKTLILHLSPILWAKSGAIAVGLSDTISKGVIDDTSAGSFLFALAFAQLPVSFIYLKLEKQSPRLLLKLKKDFSKYKFSIFSAFLIAVGQLFFWIGFESELASIVSPIATSTAAFTVLLSYFLLKEKLSKREYFGVLVVIAGVIALATQ